MKVINLQRACAAVILGLALYLPANTYAGGNIGQSIGRLERMKADQSLDSLKPGDTVAKVCKACGSVTLVRIPKGGKGAYDLSVKKCEYCGSEDTFLAMTSNDIPFKERVKR